MFERFKVWRVRKRWERKRINAEWRASNGEHLPQLERKEYDLPDWTS